MEKFQFTTKIDLQDVLHFGYWMYFIRNKMMWLLSFIFLLLLDDIVIMVSGPADIISMLIFIIFPPILYILFIFIILKKSIKSNFLSSAARNVQSIMNFDDYGLHIKEPLAKALIQWPAFFSIVETQKYFYLFTKKLSALILPKRDFENDDAIENFKKIIINHVDPEKIKFI